jgi:hypothetical protein
MKDILQDLVAHTHALGFINLVKVTSDNEGTKFESMAEDRSVILTAETSSKMVDIDGVFGMTNLDKLALHLKNPEYDKDSKIEVVEAERNGNTIPTHIHFENAAGDFQNDYRFMNAEIINEKLKTVKFKGVNWDVTLEPSVASIQRMKLQSAAHSEETTHAGKFVFQPGVEGELKHAWAWPVAAIQAILSLNGDKKMMIADAGALQITVNSGQAEYNYILPAQSK